MNQEAGIVWTTRVVVWSFCALLLWLFVLAVISVFGLKVAGKHVSDGFAYGLPLLLGAMGGGLMLNVILNLNKIGQHVALRHAGAPVPSASGVSRRWLVGVPLVLGLLAAGLFGGDHYTRTKKEQLLLQDAQASASAFSADLNALAALPWGRELVKNTTYLLTLMGKQTKQFPNVNLLMQETVQGRVAVLNLGDRYHRDDDGGEEQWTSDQGKISFIRALSADEAQYLQAAFAGKTTTHRYTADDGSYELFFPIPWGDKRKAVLHFSQHMRYGKGSF